MLLFCLLLLAGTPVVAYGQPDTLSAAERVDRLLRYRYDTGMRSGIRLGPRSLARVDQLCDGGSGYMCHGGDPDRGVCPKDALCHPAEGTFLDGLWDQALETPAAGYPMGQAVYALTKFGLVVDASDLVEACQGEAWWCRALGGYVLHARGRTSEAEPLLRAAMLEAPDDVRCSFLDASWLLGEWAQRRVSIDRVPEAWEEVASWSCERRLALSDTLFWLGDPLFSDDMNERWVEHVFRALTAEFSREIREAVRGSDLPKRDADAHWAMYIRRGAWDSFEVPLGRGAVEFWTSEEKALYSFIPEVEPDEPSLPVWRLKGNRRREGFTPSQGLFYSLPVQIARFRSDDSPMVLVAGDVRSTPLGRTTRADAFLVLSNAPGSFPVLHEREFGRDNPLFSAMIPSGDHVLSLEVVTRLGIGWHRAWLPALKGAGPLVSDLLLFDPRRSDEVSSLEEAEAAMMASPVLSGGARLGVYFELYDAPERGMREFELTIEEESGSPAKGWRIVSSGSYSETEGHSRWSSPGQIGTLEESLELALSGLEEGEYRLVLRVRWSGQDWLEGTRDFRIEG